MFEEELMKSFEKRAINMGYDISKSNGTYINTYTLELSLGYRMCNQDYIDGELEPPTN